MYVYIIFPLIAVLLDYAAYKTRGNIISFIFAVVAIGILVMGLPILIAPQITTSAATTITTSTGNIIVSSANTITNMSQSTLSLAFLFGEIAVFPQFGYVFLILSMVLTEHRNKR